MNNAPLGHAVVIGGSMAGILTAKALSERFDRVTVIERDRLPEGPEVRKGVPQARHVHSFWAGGLQAVEAMMPGARNDMVAAGAIQFGLPTEMAWLTSAGRWTQPFARTQIMTSASRPLLEGVVRNRVLETPNIQLLEEHEVTSLGVAGNGAVSGVALRDRSSGTALELSSDLLVDASGRSSKLPDWLAAVGLPTPQETVIDASLGYASRVYEVPPGLRTTWQGVYIQPDALGDGRGGIMFPIEGNRWLLTLTGGGGDYPPTDEDGFLAFADSLRSPLLAQAIRAARPLSPISGFRRTANRWRHYEKLQMPGRLLAIGDSLCAFNPVYGQGMTVAAKEVAVLRDLLKDCRSTDDLDRVMKRAQKAIATKIKGPWMLSTGSDLRFPATVGAQQTRADRMVNKYLDRVIACVADDPIVNATFLRVLNMIDEPTALFSPRIAGRVLRPRRFTGDHHPAAIPTRSRVGKEG